MKYFLQIAFGTIPFIIWMVAQTSGNAVSMVDVNILFKRIEIIIFALAGVISLFGYVYLVGREVRSKMQTCYTMAQYICMLNVITSFSYIWVIIKWMDCITGAGNTQSIDTLYSLVDITAAVNIIITIQFIFAVLFKRQILPFISIKNPKRLGDYLIDSGKITVEDINRALKKQREDAENGE